MLVRRGSGNLWAAVGKRGLPGSGVGAWALGSTVVLATLELCLRLAGLLSPELTPGIPGVSAWMPGTVVYVTALGTAEVIGGAEGYATIGMTFAGNIGM